jgi:sugar phosphate isomerase/epimerase
VDFTAFARALAAAGFTGPTVYELADGEDPGPRLGVIPTTTRSGLAPAWAGAASTWNRPAWPR